LYQYFFLSFVGAAVRTEFKLNLLLIAHTAAAVFNCRPHWKNVNKNCDWYIRVSILLRLRLIQ